MGHLIYNIDNDIVSRFFTGIKIEQSGHPCEVVGFDGPEPAMEKLVASLDTETIFPDTILLGLNISDSGMNFLKVFEELRGRPKKTEIYILLSYIGTDERKRIGEYPSVIGCLKKPLSVEDLDRLFLRWTKGGAY